MEFVVENLGEKCSGCSACVNACPAGAITFDNDDDGFWRPVVDRGKCCSCKQCVTVCPALNEIPVGTILASYAARSRDVFTRMKSASGGVFYELAVRVVARGGIVFGCALDESRMTARHVAAQTVMELRSLCGSKYVQSEMGDCFDQVKRELALGRDVLFSGTPCQVAGLRRFLGAENDKLLCIEVICHGIGSPAIYQRYLSEFGRPLADVNFRKKVAARGSSFLVRFADGTELSHPTYSDGYDYAYAQGLIHRPSCRTCTLRGAHSYADLTIGDFWGHELFVPEWSNAGGVSVAVVHTVKGWNAFQKADLALKEISFEQAAQENPSLREPFGAPDGKRTEFQKLVKDRSVIDAVRCFRRKYSEGFVRNFLRDVRTKIGDILRWLGLRKRHLNVPLRDLGIHTISRNFLLSNYGSFFQHYALREVLKRIGYRPFRIERHGCIGEVFDWLLPLRILRTRMRAWLHGDRGVYEGVGRRFYPRRLAFLHDYFKIIGCIGERQHSAHWYVCGGDCIWTQPNLRAFLADKSDDAIKVSYAVSAMWESSVRNSEWRNLVARSGEKFAGVGVREELGRVICNDIIGADRVVRVIDPVLLLKKEDYFRVAVTPQITLSKSIFSYLVNIRTDAELCLVAFKSLAQKLSCNLKILGIQGTQELLSREVNLELSPLKFLGALRDCRYFVTNSFHGLAFALIFEKPFVFVRQSLKDQNLRQTSLLELVHLEDRMIGMSELPTRGVEVLQANIDWDSVRQILDAERARSLNWLGRQLEGRE